jgi:RNAse (barnase) inhibitor barstar
VDSIYRAHNLDHLWPLVEKIINLRVHMMKKIFDSLWDVLVCEQIFCFMHLFDSVECELYGNVFHMKLVEHNQSAL